MSCFLDRNNLMIFDGGRKSLKEVEEICVDVSKLLAYGNHNKVDWSCMLSINTMKRYIEKCEEAGR